MQFTARVINPAGQMIVLYDFLATEIEWSNVNELKRALRSQPETVGSIVIEPFVRLYEEDITALAVLTGFLRVAFPAVNIELDLDRTHVPYLGMMDSIDRVKFKVIADMLNTMNFDKVIIGPAPREALRMLRGNVYPSGFFQESDWSPEVPMNFDTVCFTCAEDYRIPVCTEEQSVFAVPDPLLACAVGFSGAVADDATVVAPDAIQQYLGYNYDSNEAVILTAKGESLEGKRVLMLARDTLDINPFIAIARKLKENGAAYVGLYAIQSENNRTTTSYESAEAGSTFIDYVFVEKVDIQ